MKTKFTCASCSHNKCEVRSTCPDDETSHDKRPLTVYQIGEIPL